METTVEKRFQPNDSKHIFVFGSDSLGRHGNGGASAKEALIMGAVYGSGRGPHGRTYAIPTRKSHQIGGKIVTTDYPLYRIEIEVKKFLVYAEKRPEYDFFVQDLSKDLDYDDYSLAVMFLPVFEANMSNVHLPINFLLLLK